MQHLIGQLGTRGHHAVIRVGMVFATDLDIAGNISGKQTARVQNSISNPVHTLAQVRFSNLIIDNHT